MRPGVTLRAAHRPALRATRLDLTTMIGSSSAQAVTDRAPSRLRASLVVVQIALALVLLVGAGLLIRTFVATRTVDPGFVSSGVLALEMPISGSRFARTSAVSQLVQTAEQRVLSMPDVVSIAAASSLPLEAGVSLPFVIDRRPLLQSPHHGTANWRRVTHAYFDVFRIRLLRGRTFTDRDNADGLLVAIINDSLARRFWRDSSPLQERITIGRGIRAEFDEPSRVVIGIVADVCDTGLNRDPEPMVYVPIAQGTDSMNAFHNQAQPLQWVVRTSGAPIRLRPAIERELRASGSDLLIGRIRTMDEIVAESTARNDFTTTVLTLFAAIALSLSAVGIYGLMAYSIQQRTREIAVRMALGAAPWAVRGMVLVEGVRLTLAGVFLGTAAAMVLSRFMVSLIYGVGPWNPIVFGGVAVLLCSVSILAILLSARRATAVQPTEALRQV